MFTAPPLTLSYIPERTDTIFLPLIHSEPICWPQLFPSLRSFLLGTSGPICPFSFRWNGNSALSSQSCCFSDVLCNMFGWVDSCGWYEGFSKSNAQCAILLVHDIRSGCWWYGSTGWTSSPVLHFIKRSITVLMKTQKIETRVIKELREQESLQGLFSVVWFQDSDNNTIERTLSYSSSVNAN